MRASVLTRPSIATASLRPTGSPAAEAGLVIEFHQWPLPCYIWPAVHRLYRSIFCSEPHLRIHQTLDKDTQVWVARQYGEIVAVILFQIRDRVARVVNEMHELPAEHLNHFMQDLLREYPSTDALRFHALHITGRCGVFPVLQIDYSADYLLRLPKSVDAWHASLSPRNREKLRYFYRRTLRKQPDLRFRQIDAASMTLLEFERILQLNRERMKKKQRAFQMSAREKDGLFFLMKECGSLSVIEINGEISAGLLCTRLENSVFMHVIAHDPRYDDLRLGFLCCAMTIEAAINQGADRFHFLWGDYDYKVRLGGQRQPLYRAVMFRSWCRTLRHPVLCADYLIRRIRQRIIQWRQA